MAWASSHLPKTPLSIKTTRGVHLIYRRPKQVVRNSAGMLGLKLDVRGDGGYILAPGSIKGDCQRLPSVDITPELVASLPIYNPDWFNVQRYLGNEYLADKQGTIQGEGAESILFGYIHHLIDLGVSRDDMVQMLCEWGCRSSNRSNTGAYYPWEQSDIERKIDLALSSHDTNFLVASEIATEVVNLSGQVVDEPEQAEPVKKKRFLRRDDLKNLPKQTFLVDQHIPNNSIVGLVGASGEKKTFFALDLALSISTGTPALDKYNTTQGKVLYIIGEGIFGIDKRITAWEEARGTPAEITFLNEQCDLSADTTAEEILADYREEIGGQPVLIVLDTLNKLFGGGDENSTKDMSRFVRSCETLRQQSGASVLIVHHLGKNESAGARGANALLCALDVEIKLSDGEVKFSKVKDFAAPTTYAIAHKQVGDSLVLSTGVASISDSEVSILSHLSQSKEKTKAEICNLTGLADRTVRQYLTNLQKADRIKVTTNPDGAKCYTLPA